MCPFCAYAFSMLLGIIFFPIFNFCLLFLYRLRRQIISISIHMIIYIDGLNVLLKHRMYFVQHNLNRKYCNFFNEAIGYTKTYSLFFFFSDHVTNSVHTDICYVHNFFYTYNYYTNCMF